MNASSPSQRQRHQAREHAEHLERDAAAYPEERAEILLEAAGQWALAGEDERALEVYDDLVATASKEDAQWAIAGKIEVLHRIGRSDEARTLMARLRESPADPGPAGLVAEYLESQDRLDEALTWFNIACRDLLADDDSEIEPGVTLVRPELDGRARVRKALGLPPDALDQRVDEQRAELTAMLDRAAARDTLPAAKRSAGLGSFFVRSDVERAFAEGLVHVEDPEDDDVASYFRRVERGWRSSARENGVTRFVILPTTVDDLLKYAEEVSGDPRDEQTRLDYLQDRVDEGALTISWPPERNQPCWCDSGRKYKKCCGAATNR